MDGCDYWARLTSRSHSSQLSMSGHQKIFLEGPATLYATVSLNSCLDRKVTGRTRNLVELHDTNLAWIKIARGSLSIVHTDLCGTNLGVMARPGASCTIWPGWMTSS